MQADLQEQNWFCSRSFKC